VVGDTVGPKLPRPERPEKDRAGEGGDQHDGDEARRPCGSEDRAGDEEGGDRRGVVELDRRLVRDLREQVGGELRDRREEHQRREEEGAREWQCELE
jgi:hypothetical protein